MATMRPRGKPFADKVFAHFKAFQTGRPTGRHTNVCLARTECEEALSMAQRLSKWGRGSNTGEGDGECQLSSLSVSTAVLQTSAVPVDSKFHDCVDVREDFCTALGKVEIDESYSRELMINHECDGRERLGMDLYYNFVKLSKKELAPKECFSYALRVIGRSFLWGIWLLMYFLDFSAILLLIVFLAGLRSKFPTVIRDVVRSILHACLGQGWLLVWQECTN